LNSDPAAPSSGTCEAPGSPGSRDLRGLLLRAWPALAAILSGVLLALCYPPFEIGALVWIWSAPLLAALWFSPAKRARDGFLLGYLAGLAFFGLSLSWLLELSRVAGTAWAGIGALGSITLYLALYFGAFGAFAVTVGRWSPREPGAGAGAGAVGSSKGGLFAPSMEVLRAAFLNGAAWCGLEWLRGVVFGGFGWNGLGVALVDQLLLLQFAEVVGINGYGFILMFCGIVAFGTVVRLGREIKVRRRARPHLDFALGVGVVIGLFLHGITAVAKRPDETVTLRARIMQMNIPLEEKWSEDLTRLQRIIYDYRDLTRTFVEASPHDLVLWPETAIPGHFSFPWVQEYFNDHVLLGDDFYLLTGLEDSSLEGDEIYNTVTLMRGSTESYQMHHKTHLVPMGEYIPFRGRFPLFEWIGGGLIENDFVAGDSYEPLLLEKDGVTIGIIPLICFEDTMGRLTRRFVREAPQLIVNVTNDGWFYESAESMQHFHNAIIRCIEVRRPMIRAANTGVSAFIDERGSVFERDSRDRHPRILRDEATGSTFIRGSLPAEVEIDLHPPTTVYARIGDAPSVALGLFALFAAGLRWLMRRRQRGGAERSR